MLYGVHDYMEGVPQERPKGGKPERVIETCTCAICKKGNVTLLKREGVYICKTCYRRLLSLRALEKQQEGEKDHGG